MVVACLACIGECCLWCQIVCSNDHQIVFPNCLHLHHSPESGYVWYKSWQLKITIRTQVVACLTCIGECCLWCLEKFLDFINKNAYIQVLSPFQPHLGGAAAGW